MPSGVYERKNKWFWSEGSKLKISLARKGTNLGKNHYNWKGGKKKCHVCSKFISHGSIHTICKICFNKSMTGEKHPNWKGGISSFSEKFRSTIEYKIWRKKVFERDNYTCQECKTKGKILNAHHIKQFSEYPDLRLEINNGITLCIDCHKKTDTWGWPKKKVVIKN